MSVPLFIIRKLKQLGLPWEVDIVNNDKKKGDTSNNDGNRVRDDEYYECFRMTVLWLEEQHIRLYTERRREVLREYNSSWWNHLLAYCNELEISFSTPKITDSIENRIMILDALTCRAIEEFYMDTVEDGKMKLKENSTLTNSEIDHENDDEKVNEIQNMKATLFNYIPLLNKTMQYLQLPPLSIPNSPDLSSSEIHEIASAIRVMCIRLMPDNNNSTKLNKESIRQMLDFPIAYAFKYIRKETCANYDFIHDCVAVARILHQNEMHIAQFHCNQTIDKFQLVTANPKTDASLGKVGI